ncbi:MAG: peptidoglycan DD-metalloendopeptidase family protein [Oscillospiraceae bacterium]|nr:peptidoglycan DD-metalloendopeptidase family protein [Oscillospiraceae bacterium]
MNKNIQTLLAKILVAIMILGLFAALIQPALAVSEEEIERLKRQRDEIAEEKAEKQAIVDDLESKQASVLELKHALDERNEFTRQQIELNVREIELYQEMILKKAAELDAAVAQEEEQMNRYRTRVRAMEENGGYDFLSLLMNTADLGEFLTAMDDIGEIMESDKHLEESYIAARETVERVKAEYEAVKTDLEARQKALYEEQLELERQIQEATDHINQLIEEIQQHQAEIDELDEEQQAKQHEIDVLVDELERQRAAEEERRRKEEEERRRREEESKPTGGETGGETGSGDSGSSYSATTGTGSFGWPCPGCYYVTSRMGNRFHPIFNEWRYHSGMDIGAGYGSAIVASDSGTVSWCGEKGGYGNCIMIDHGNGYYTLYGHMSSYAVSYGDIVSKGQTIGYVGSTGWATGPHLHFEIRYGDSCLDPEAVAGFTGLTYAEDAGE